MVEREVEVELVVSFGYREPLHQLYILGTTCSHVQAQHGAFGGEVNQLDYG